MEKRTDALETAAKKITAMQNGVPPYMIFLDEFEVEALGGPSVSKQRADRVKGKGLRFRKFGRSVRIPLDELMNGPSYQSTTEADHAAR